jgi:hypothetical protein
MTVQHQLRAIFDRGDIAGVEVIPDYLDGFLADFAPKVGSTVLNLRI